MADPLGTPLGLNASPMPGGFPFFYEMLPAYGRAFLRVLVVVGVSGLAVEVVFITFNVLNPARDNMTLDRMLGETAYSAFIYGAFFVLAVLARKSPAWAFRPLHSYQVQGKKRIGPRIVAPLGFVLFAVVALMQLVFLANGWATARDAMVSLLHAYPIAGDSSPLE